MSRIEITNEDNMVLMARYPDKYFELAIVDPPYGINVAENMGKWFRQRGEKEKEWDAIAPNEKYFNELFRVSRNQIIWGGNYFSLHPSRCFAVWDKGAGMRGRSYAECEYAWISFDENAAMFNYDPLANGDYRGKIHPTQKPVSLYKWLLSRYAKPGDKILDTHLGSGSIAIACHDLGFDLTACELDEDYYKAAMARLATHQAQCALFDPAEIRSTPVQKDLL